MSNELSVVTVIVSTIGALAIFGGIVRWAITKYFEKSEALDKLKESAVLKEIGRVGLDVQSLNTKNSETILKLEKMSVTVGALVKNHKALMQSNLEAVQMSAKADERLNELEEIVHNHRHL